MTRRSDSLRKILPHSTSPVQQNRRVTSRHNRHPWLRKAPKRINKQTHTGIKTAAAVHTAVSKQASPMHAPAAYVRTDGWGGLHSALSLVHGFKQEKAGSPGPRRMVGDSENDQRDGSPKQKGKPGCRLRRENNGSKHSTTMQQGG